MCQIYDNAAIEVTKIVEKIRYDDLSLTLDDIYRELENKHIMTKRYSPGISIKAYLDNLVSVGAIECYDTTYFHHKKHC